MAAAGAHALIGSCSVSCGGGVRQGLVYECINADVRCSLHTQKHAPVPPSVVALSHNMAPYVATNNVPYVATMCPALQHVRCTLRSISSPILLRGYPKHGPEVPAPPTLP